MGFLNDISKWLSGGKKIDSVRSASMKLKVFNKKLMRQTKKSDFIVKIARDKAVNLRKQGVPNGSYYPLAGGGYLKFRRPSINN
ncbi:MAG: hypothetical protein ACXAC5_08910 [Promethearchaeota archaeon]|jgi:hypothetical protein